MALKRIVKIFAGAVAFVTALVLVLELQNFFETRRYNAAIANATYEQAENLLGDRGKFAKAYAERAQNNIDSAHVIYGDVGRSDDLELRAAALYNLGNSYLQQVLAMDIEKDSDRAYPLIELAKMSYRKSLAVDSENWDARRNLEKALLLLPDANPKVPMEVQGRRGAVRTVISADSEKNFP